jgi:hypothetical protein
MEAQRRCRLSDEEVTMAKALGLQPRSLIKNIPAASQTWKAPVSDWIRSLYDKKFGAPPVQAPREKAKVLEFRNPAYPWSDKPDIPDLAPFDPDQFADNVNDMGWIDESGFQNNFDPPSQEETDEENTLMLRRQCLFRWAAQSIAVSMSELTPVMKVAAFGAVAQPLEMEVPRFSQFRRHRIEILHECADLDLAVWTKDLGKLQDLKKALQRGLSMVHDTPHGGVAHHQVDVHVFDADTGAYGGRLCIFKECPKPGKRECLVPGCGAKPFLQQFSRYRFNPAQFEGEPKVVLFDRASGFVVRRPKIDGKLRPMVSRTVRDDDIP